MTQNEWYKYCTENGLCVSCHKPSDNGKRYCSKCAAKAKRRNAEQREFYLARGICPICRSNDLVGDEKSCVECRAKQAKRDRKRNKRHAYSFKKIRRTKMKEQGRCIECGNPLDEYGYTRCSSCREKRRRKYAKTQAIQRDKRIANGRCYICGSRDLADGQKLCVQCYKRSLKNAKKMNESRRKQGAMKMDHDYAHCSNFQQRECPEECFRAQLVRDLAPGIPVSWAYFKGTSECPLNRKEPNEED